MDMGKMPPQAVELEVAVLGAVMLEKEAYYNVVEYFKPEIFYKENHSTIAEAIISVANRSEPVDILTVTQELIKMGKLQEVGGAYYVTSLANGVSSSASIDFHMKLLVQFAIKREVIVTGSNMIKEAYDETTDVFDVIDLAERKVTALTNQIITSKIESVATLYNKSIKHNELLRTKKGLAGVPSGFEKMDRITGGWQKTDLIIVAARPGMGKTALLLGYARNAAVRYKMPIAIFSLEMSSLQLMARLQSQETGTPLENYLRIGLNDLEAQMDMEGCTHLINSDLYIDDTPAITVFELKNKARKLKRDKNIQAIFIDYLQLVKGGGKFQNKEAEVSFVSNSLKALAKELDIPVIALAQLSRSVESRGGDKIPTLADLRDSGAIEQDADMIQFIYRPEYYNIFQDEAGNDTKGKAMIIIAKHRNGSVDQVKLGWVGSCTKFTDPNNDNQYNSNAILAADNYDNNSN